LAGTKNPNLGRSTRFTKPYFIASFIAYCLGLGTTIYVMHVFKAAQPALLYLSPACILSVLITGLARGELKEVFAYTSEDKKKADKAKEAEKEDKKTDDKKADKKKESDEKANPSSDSEQEKNTNNSENRKVRKRKGSKK
jgi:minor histocompatibility antigen H13